MKRSFLLLALVLSVVVNAAPALADGDFYVVAVGGGIGTKITSLPYPINNPGFYYLASNLTATSGNGITVNVDNVTIDLMGFCLSGNSSYYGIYMNGRKNVEIRNGILSGWNTGINEIGFSSTGHQIINLRVDGAYNGFWLMGEGLIKGCTVTAPASNEHYIGIHLNGTGTISGCKVKNFTNSENGAAGILLGKGLCSGNVVENCYNGLLIARSGSIIGNTFLTNLGQKGIVINGSPIDYVLLDQNTATGQGTHLVIGNTGVTCVKGTNAGF